MRKALVFVTAFALVLVAGAAVAFMATPGADGAVGNEVFEEPVAPDTLEKEKEEPPAEEEVTEEKSEEDVLIEEEKREEEPPQKEEEETRQEEVKDEEDTTPPDLVILFPEDGQRFDRKEIAFEGKTEATARVFAGDYEADVDDEGNWRIVLFLKEGGNTTTITASDEAGNEATARVQAFYEAPKEVEEPEEEEEPKEERKEEPKELDFSANQKYGSCAEDVPYDEWTGTGSPGTEIWIGNDWGSATTTIGDNGEWFLKVTFPDMPCDTQTVFLETNDGDKKVYEFTRVCNGSADDEEK